MIWDEAFDDMRIELVDGKSVIVEGGQMAIDKTGLRIWYAKYVGQVTADFEFYPQGLIRSLAWSTVKVDAQYS